MSARCRVNFAKTRLGYDGPGADRAVDMTERAAAPRRHPARWTARSIPRAVVQGTALGVRTGLRVRDASRVRGRSRGTAHHQFRLEEQLVVVDRRTADLPGQQVHRGPAHRLD